MRGIVILDCGIEMDEMAGPLACCSSISMTTR